MMSATIWSKFFWADWLSDTNLRRCSPAARGLWMDMLCIAAQAAPYGYLAKDGQPLDAGRLARNVGMSESEVAGLLAELESEGVFSRDRHGRIYSRRMVRDARRMKAAVRSGRKGGRVSSEKQRGIFRPSKGRREGGVEGTLAPISQKPEAISQKPAEGDAVAAPAAGGGWQNAQAAVARAARLMRVTPEALRRRTAWIVFPEMVAHLVAQGCEAERDVWPTIERLAARLKSPPATPQYFRGAILEARDERLARGGPHAAGLVEWQDRLAVFAREGAWSSRWGPKPGEAGCLAPEREVRNEK